MSSLPALPSGPDSVHGTVLNRATREPIARALVHTPDNRFAAMTNDRGQFEFKFPPQDKTQPPAINSIRSLEEMRTVEEWFSRNYRPDRILAQKPGFLADPMGVSISGTDGEHVEVEILLEPEAHIIGRVQLPDSDSTDRIRLQLYRQEFEEGHERWVQASTFTTWANGDFRFYDLAAGTYKLVTLEQTERDPASFNPSDQLFGYPPSFFGNTHDFASATPIHLASGETFQANISLTRQEYFPVKIRVANAPAAGAPIVEVYPQGKAGPGFSLGYDASEQQVRGSLPNGNFTVRVATQIQESSSGLLNFSVRGGPVENQSVILLPNASLTVNVRKEFSEVPSGGNAEPQGDDDAHAVANGWVNVVLTPVEQFGMQRGANSQPTTEGSFATLAIYNVASGSYWLRIESANGYAASAVWGGTDVLRHPLTVSSDGSSVPIELTLSNDGAEVSGAVQSQQSTNSSSSKGAAIVPSQAYIYFVPVSDSSGQFRETQTTPDGQFKQTQIPPGTYRVLAFDHQKGELGSANGEILRRYESAGIVIQLSPNQNLELSSPLALEREP